MYSRGDNVWSRCENRARLDPTAARIFPPIPQSSEREHLALIDFKAVGLLRFARARPFVKAVCRDQAPAELKGVAKRRLSGGSLRLCV